MDVYLPKVTHNKYPPRKKITPKTLGRIYNPGYSNVCLLDGNDLEIACSGNNYVAGETINFFKEFHKQFFRPVTDTLKIVWESQYARVADLEIFYYDPIEDFQDVTNDSNDGSPYEVIYWKDCFTNMLAEEMIRFQFNENTGKTDTMLACARKCLQENNKT